MTTLDLGCGDAKVNRGAVGFDFRRLPGVDVTGDARVLPFRDESFNIIHCFHVIEHFTKRDAKDVLRECLRVLVPGGALYLACPDMAAMAQTYLRYVQMRNWTELEKLTANYYGGWSLFNDYRQNKHEWGYSFFPLQSVLMEVGFADVVEVPRRDLHEIYVEASKE